MPLQHTHTLLVIETLPSELQRSFSLIKELDSECQRMIKDTEAQGREYMENASKMSVNERRNAIRAMLLNLSECAAHGEDKVSLAVQIYTVVR